MLNVFGETRFQARLIKAMTPSVMADFTALVHIKNYILENKHVWAVEFRWATRYEVA